MQTTRTSAVIICILVVLLQPTVVPALEPVTLTLLASAVGAIGSLAGGAGSLIFGEVLIAGKITVENWTRFPMMYPSIVLGDGVLVSAIQSIAPGGSTYFVVRKDRFTATGSYGTASWQMTTDRWSSPFRAVVMWSVPYDYNLYSNHLAVGATRSGNQGSWYDQMYYGSGTWFTRRRYLNTIANTVYMNYGIEIQAQMGTGHDADVHVRVLPLRDTDLADSKKQEARRINNKK